MPRFIWALLISLLVTPAVAQEPTVEQRAIVRGCVTLLAQTEFNWYWEWNGFKEMTEEEKMVRCITRSLLLLNEHKGRRDDPPQIAL